MLEIFMQDRKKFYMVTFVLLGILVPINYFLFKDVPDNPFELLQEAIVHHVFGVKIDISEVKEEIEVDSGESSEKNSENAKEEF